MQAMSQEENSQRTDEKAMTKRKNKIVCKIFLPFWLVLYLDALRFFVFITGAKPDANKVSRLVAKHARVKPVKSVTIRA